MSRPTILVALLGTLTACAPHQGTFTATVVPPAAALAPSTAAFLWASRGNTQTGEIESALRDGEGFTGSFVELHATMYPESIVDLYGDWYEGWTGRLAAGWPRLEIREYIRAHEDQVVAVLSGDRGRRMRCEFELVDAAAGMRGGGVGRCQLSDGAVIAAHFDATQESEEPPRGPFDGTAAAVVVRR